MSTRHQIVQRMHDEMLVPCWRWDDTSGIVDASKAMVDIGLSVVELTMTMPGNLKLIERCAAELPRALVGVGTVLDAETARMAILAGAKYVVTPVLVPDVVQMCHRYDIPAIIGAQSWTEIVAAKTLGADVIKVCPAGIGGPGHLGEVRSVFPGVTTVVSGQVRLSDIPAFLTAGADCAVIGMPNIAVEAYAKRDWASMQAFAKRLLALCRDARSPETRKRAAEAGAARYVDLSAAEQAVASAKAR
jgi:2-dehydro-3-deoxyphosphogluconate aldolase / (4S)-4-hydroxy-2-oxoglutarate aldolase